jgi:hypothetical protein
LIVKKITKHPLLKVTLPNFFTVLPIG